MKQLDPLAQRAIADLAEKIAELDRAVDRLAAADVQYRRLAGLDRAVRSNGHLKGPSDEH